MTATRPRILTLAAVVAMAFGILTVASGTRALMAPGPGVVPFVLWFNFAAGFAYVLAGAGILRGETWAPLLALAIALATAAVYLAFLVHVWRGGPWMGRTMGAMALRTAVWTAIAAIVLRHRGWREGE